MLNIAEYCLSKPLAEETYPFGPSTTVYKVRGKMFALTPATEKPASINLKCDPLRARILRQDHPEITPGYHMNKEHWNTLDLNGRLPEELICELVDHSYELVSQK